MQTLGSLYTNIVNYYYPDIIEDEEDDIKSTTNDSIVKCVKSLNELKYEILIFGYIRQHTVLLKLSEFNLFQQIPISITNLCILFYLNEEFKLIGTKTYLSNYCKTISQCSGYGGFNNKNYGLINIASHTNMICDWYFKILNVKVPSHMPPENQYDNMPSFRLYSMYRFVNRNAIRIGIDSTVNVDGLIILNNPLKPFYHFNGFSRVKESHDTCAKYGKAFLPGDIVRMNLNLKQKRIMYFINGQNMGIAYDDIVTNKNISYRLTLSLCFLTGVEII